MSYEYGALKGSVFEVISLDDAAVWAENDYSIWRREISGTTTQGYIDELETETQGTAEDEVEDVVSEAVNVLPQSVDYDGTVYGDNGCMPNYSLDENGNDVSLDGSYVTGYIQVDLNDTVYLSDISLRPTSTTSMIAFYDIDKNIIVSSNINDWLNIQGLLQPSISGENVESFIVAGSEISESSTEEGSSGEESEEDSEEDADLIDPSIGGGSDSYNNSYVIDNVAYFRMSCDSISDNSAIYINNNEQTASGEESETIEEYDPADDGWEEITDMLDTVIEEYEEESLTTVNATGFFIYEDKYDDGSAIYYLHNLSDDPNRYTEDSTTDTTIVGHVMGGLDNDKNRAFPESDLVWKITAQRVDMSTDGGCTYPFKIAVDGDAILNKINAKKSITIGNSTNNNIKITDTDIQVQKGGATVATFGANCEISNIKAESGTIAGLTLGTNGSTKYMASNSKKALYDGVSGVYIGTDGIEVGNGNFSASKTGDLQCKQFKTTDSVQVGSLAGAYSRIVDDTLSFMNAGGNSSDCMIRSVGMIQLKADYDEDITPNTGYTLQFLREQSGDGRTILMPATSGAIYIGTSSNRFNTAFFAKEITASDLKEKDIIEDFDLQAENFILGLKPIAYKRIGSEDGGKRIHMGFGAQDVSQLCNDINLGDMAIYQASIKNEDGSESPYNGEEIDDSKLSWGLSYGEFIAPIVAEMQNLIKKNKELEERVQALERGDSNE